MIKRWSAVLLAAVVFGAAAPQASAEPEIPSNIYHWVQSTARQNYYFNKDQMRYGIDDEGNVDTNILIVPTLKTYDDVQIEDVTSKRRWKMQSVDGYRDLTGAADYYSFNVSEGTVTLLEHDDLNSSWGTLDQEIPETPQVERLADFTAVDVDARFYRAILFYAEDHADAIMANTDAELARRGLTRGKVLRVKDKQDQTEKTATHHKRHHHDK